MSPHARAKREFGLDDKQSPHARAKREFGLETRASPHARAKRSPGCPSDSEGSGASKREFGLDEEQSPPRALATSVQGALERVYQLDRVADVRDYVHGAQAGEREALLLRSGSDGTLELTLRLPTLEDGEADLDSLCQIIEGVSHFVYILERARTEREATQLELELQAEVDKWVVLAASMRHFDLQRSAALRRRLYERVCFEHDRETELGERYRVANDAAHRFVLRLERKYLMRGRYGELRSELRRFFHVGQEEKLRIGRSEAA